MSNNANNTLAMPKFYCNHCGQRIDAGDELAGTSAACPACGGKIIVPQIIAHRKVAPPSAMNLHSIGAQPKSGARRASSVLGMVCFLLAVLLIGRACGLNHGQQAAEQVNSRQSVPPRNSSSDFAKIEKGGLAMQLPKNLISLTRTQDFGDELELLEKFTSMAGTRGIILKHFIFKSPRTISPTEAADAQERDLKKQAGYTARRRSLTVSGLDGLILNANYKTGTESVEHSILYFSKGHELWEISLYGVNDKQTTDLKTMKEKVFSSIEIKN